MQKYLTRLITKILTDDEASRDDWMLTIRKVHDMELQLWGHTKEEYYQAFFAEKVSNVHTIRRIWQLVQERRPELRGETWEERQRMGGMIAKEYAAMQDIQSSLFD